MYLPEGSLGRQELKAHTAILKQELQNSRDRVMSIRAQLESAEADAASILAAVNDHTSICPPVHDIPPEILTRIFSFTTGRHFSIYKVEEGPWILGKVCSRWRTVSRSSPYLWSSFTLYTPQDLVIKDITPVVRRLEAVLEHSKQVTLHIWMEAFGSPEIARAIEPHSSRIFSLQVGGQIGYLSRKNCLKMVDLPSLVDLTLDLGELPTDNFRTYMDLSKCAPRLTRLTLRLRQDHSIVLQSKALILPYNQLTDLWIYQPADVVQILKVLPHCAQLVSYRDNTPYSFEEQSTQSITLPCLRYVRCRWPSLIPVLVCPSLKSLDFTSGLRPFKLTEASSATMQEFLQRSRCEVDVLTLDLWKGIEGKSFARDFVANFSSIRKLSVGFKNQYDAGDITSLLKYNVSESLLPRLRTLYLTCNGWCSSRPDRGQSAGCSDSNTDSDPGERVVIDVIQSRRVVVDEIKTLDTVRVGFGLEVDLEQEGVKSLLAIPTYWPYYD